MNIFAIDADPEDAACGLHDVHVNKMLVESCQLLATAHPSGESPYAITHVNHPCARWTRQSAANYSWLACYALALSAERASRWPHRSEHTSTSAALWYAAHVPALAEIEPTEFALAVPHELRVAGDVIASYRAYYVARKLLMKRGTVRWTGRRPPPWLYEALARGRGDLRIEARNGRYEVVVGTCGQ